MNQNILASSSAAAVSTHERPVVFRRDSATAVAVAGPTAGAGRDAVKRAVSALRRYQRRQLRIEHPDGYFDSAKRWYPNEIEDSDDFTCYTRSPSRLYPYSYMLAARSMAHCEALAGANHRLVLALRRAGITGAADDQYAHLTPKAAARWLYAGAQKWLAAHPGRARKTPVARAA